MSGAILASLLAGPAAAQSGEEAVKGAVASWYAELRKGRDARLDSMLAPGGMVVPDHDFRSPGGVKRQSRAADPHRQRFAHLLAVRAEKFSYEVRQLRVEATLAKAMVWERGWIYAWAAKSTYENAAAATFVLEKRDGEDWKILIYASNPEAVRPDHRNEPMPDLRPKEQ